MYRVMWQEGSEIEIGLYEELTREEFMEVLHKLEALAAEHPRVSVMFDAVDLESYEFRIVWDEVNFYREYKDHLHKIAVVSDNRFHQFVIKLFAPFSGLELRTFPGGKVEEARNWVFPPRLL